MALCVSFLALFPVKCGALPLRKLWHAFTLSAAGELVTEEFLRGETGVHLITPIVCGL